MSSKSPRSTMARSLNRRRLLQIGSLMGAGAGTLPVLPASARSPVRTSGALTKAQGTAEGTVQFWHVWGGDREPLIEDVIADFEQQYPDVNIDATLLSQEGLQEKYLTAIAAGTPPDVMQLHSRDLPNFASRSALRGVEDLIERDNLDVEEMFYPAELEVSRYEGDLYGLPVTVGGGNYLVFWNKEHFREVGLDPEIGPRTWDELVEFSTALTRGNDGDFERVGCLYTGLPTPRPSWFLEWAYCNAGQLYSADGREVMFDAPENVEALAWMLESLEKNYGGWENVRSFLSGGGSGGEGNQAFFQGSISIHLQGVYHFLQLSVEAPDLDYGVTIPPYNANNPAAESTVYVDGNWNYVLPRGAKNTDSSWELIKYLCAGPGQVDFFLPQGRPSVVPAYNTDPEYQAGNPDWPVVQQVLEISRAAPTTRLYAEDMSILSQYVEEALLNRRSAEEALRIAREEAQRLHDDELED